jgi:hypothetical protein
MKLSFLSMMAFVALVMASSLQCLRAPILHLGRHWRPGISATVAAKLALPKDHIKPL